MNSESAIDPKFWVSSQIEFDNWPDFGDGNQIINSGNKKIAVVYQTWSTEKYIPYIYFSLLGQVIYTDILEHADIYIFVDEERYDFLCWLFRNVLDRSHIIKVSRMMAVKYMITCHPDLQDYEIVTVVDSDMFFYSKSGNKTNMYQTILDKTDVITRGPLMIVSNGESAKDIFWSRKKDLCKSLNKSDYLNMILSGSGMSETTFNHWMSRSNWPLSCIFIYSPSLFKNPAYHKYALTNSYRGQYCDETVWVSWALARKNKYFNFTSVTKIPVYLNIDSNLKNQLDKYGELVLLHPLTGSNRKNQTMLNILKDIKNVFEKNYAGRKVK